jgi:two-component system, chemotaxis family, sensor kinase CheA
MDDLLREFLTETNERLDVVDVELVRFEQDPNNARILANIFRLVHTIKGTCGFPGLPRLEALTHAAETLMGKFRDGLPATGAAVTLILSTIDRIKRLLDELERQQQEPEGFDRDLIDELERLAIDSAAAAPASAATSGTLTYQVLERPLRPGEVALDDLERAFRETAVDPPATVGKVAPARPATAVPTNGTAHPGPSEDEHSDSKVANQSIRVNVGTLEHLMTMVSELVLTRNSIVPA